MEIKQKKEVSIWWFAFGYFAAYVPYTSLTKYLSKTHGIAGNQLLPVTAIASMFAMFVFISAMGWWQYATRKKVGKFSIPVPGIWTFLSGLCTAAIIPTTTLAYTFGGISILFMMLLMRGGVLVIAPIADFFSGRKVRWYSWAALALALGALVASFLLDQKLTGKGSVTITMPAIITLLIYLSAYFIRLRFMSRLAKSDDENARLRYFVEEQMVATPSLVIFLGVMAIAGNQFGFGGQMPRDLAAGFTTFLTSGFVLVAILIGVLSQGTGVFGGLILLDKRENTFCVPVNRASSILAGIVASYALFILVPNTKAPSVPELVGAGMIIAALALLSIPPIFEKRKARLAAAAAAAAVAPAPAESEVAAAPSQRASGS